MTNHPFDPGPVAEPFAGLCRAYPGQEAYPPEDFRVEWGPIFHRGRLDGSARILVLGQDPGQHESIARRILVGEAGQRVQGFLGKLGIDSSYVMLNAFLYSVYGQGGGERHRDDHAIVEYRTRWLDALLVDTGVEAVVAFGHLAHDALDRWLATPAGTGASLHCERLPHPTMPEASSKGDEAKRAAAMKAMLGEWNQALERLDGQLGQRDANRPLEPYSDDLRPEDLAAIPEQDLPAGTPPWMRSLKQWAAREGTTADAKRATVVVTVPNGERPWQ
jgi:uracil-DNA glycosylase